MGIISTGGGNMNRLKLLILLTLFFIVLTEKMSVLDIGVGALVALGIVLLNREMLLNINWFRLGTALMWLEFVLVLIKEVIVSNLQVAKIVLEREMEISPQIVAFDSKLKDDFLLTILANVITLTPGTMTVDIDGSHMKIHCLTKSYADGLADGQLEKILLKIEGSAARG